MEIILDSNVLFRTLISGGDILELFFKINLTIFAPEKLKEEFEMHEAELLRKSEMSEIEFEELANLIFGRINLVPRANFSSFLVPAKALLGNHEKDEDFVALALMKEVKVWTYEILLFKIGIGISTKEIALALSSG